MAKIFQIRASALVAIAMIEVTSIGQLKTDSAVYLEPSLPPLPSASGKLTDPVFNTTIMRLTDANDGSDCQVQYSYWPSFNLNSTYVQAQCVVNGIFQLKIWHFD